MLPTQERKQITTEYQEFIDKANELVEKDLTKYPRDKREPADFLLFKIGDVI